MIMNQQLKLSFLADSFLKEEKRYTLTDVIKINNLSSREEIILDNIYQRLLVRFVPQLP